MNSRDSRAPGARFVRAANLDEVRAAGLMPVSIEGHALVLASEGEAVHAFQSTCPHEMADLSLGRIEAGCLVCPRHRAAFSLKDGSVSAGWTDVSALKLYPTRLADGVVYVDAAALARNPPGGKRQVWDLSR